MGWTISDAALFLGVSRQHLYMVLTGRRVSKRLTAKVDALPYRRLTRMRRSK
ncbi:transcriptional regulator [Akkermansia muciniphila]|nr:transcriptional regulator [Akkermansia muciniphila]DAZ33478.1 MAG TPA: PURINE NUCLEOTIDE SYNTHESIS REPRESSOR/DNA Complex REGULATION, DNA-BINDING, REPRESSOR, PURINE [Caudoviricetes sp.]PND00783.1 transcriptional regulator [Akkermansia muciniphila]PND03140.1 transcriptional regulator [Akkermansia muciniphila]PND11364.1 transcriptional regulator [Akkermansia muciniphila]